MSMKTYLIALSVATLLSGCAHLTDNNSAEYASSNLQQFAYDLGSTQAGLARCSSVSAIQLDAHMESVQLALKAQAGKHLSEVLPAFEKGLQEPAGSQQAAYVDCSCAPEIVRESRIHNLRLYSAVALPKAYSRAN